MTNTQNIFKDLYDYLYSWEECAICANMVRLDRINTYEENYGDDDSIFTHICDDCDN